MILHCSGVRIEDSQQKGLAGPEGVERRTRLLTIAEATALWPPSVSGGHETPFRRYSELEFEPLIAMHPLRLGQRHPVVEGE